MNPEFVRTTPTNSDVESDDTDDTVTSEPSSNKKQKPVLKTTAPQQQQQLQPKKKGGDDVLQTVSLSEDDVEEESAGTAVGPKGTKTTSVVSSVGVGGVKLWKPKYTIRGWVCLLLFIY